jgi:hypothetical protein
VQVQEKPQLPSEGGPWGSVLPVSRLWKKISRKKCAWWAYPALPPKNLYPTRHKMVEWCLLIILLLYIRSIKHLAENNKYQIVGFVLQRNCMI